MGWPHRWESFSVYEHVVLDDPPSTPITSYCLLTGSPGYPHTNRQWKCQAFPCLPGALLNAVPSAMRALLLDVHHPPGSISSSVKSPLNLLKDDWPCPLSLILPIHSPLLLFTSHSSSIIPVCIYYPHWTKPCWPTPKVFISPAPSTVPGTEKVPRKFCWMNKRMS